MYDYLIVGAGLFGATLAWHAQRAGKRVIVIDSRPHVAGNCYTEEVAGIQVHRYGPHVFHTSDERVWAFVNRFARFNRYVHRVKATDGDRVFSLPINLMTLHQLWGVSSPLEARQKLDSVRVQFHPPRNLEEWALSQVGRELYDTLFYGYTKKQWGREPSTLPAAILKRLPIRLTWDDSYYDDAYQGIPVGGYTPLVQQLLDGCDVKLGTDFFHDRYQLERLSRRTVYTGTIDGFYNHRLGTLGYRTMEFDTRVLHVADYQGLAQMNHTSESVPWTRVVEHKHFDPPGPRGTTVVTAETPVPWHEGATPYYPINDDANNQLLAQYQRLAATEARTVFGGRLGSYRYYDMHQAIAAAIHLAKREGLTT